MHRCTRLRKGMGGNSRKAKRVAYIVSYVPAFVDGVRALLAGFFFRGSRLLPFFERTDDRIPSR